MSSELESNPAPEPINNLCWIRQLNKHVFNPTRADIQAYLRTKRNTSNILPPATYKPYGGPPMTLESSRYQNAQTCDLRFTPSVGFKKINNQDLFIIKNMKQNNDIITAALKDFVIINKD